MRINRIIFVFASILVFGNVSLVSAHSGRTNSSGCHNCNVGSCAGTYHCHNGGGYTAPPVYVAPRCVSSVGNSGNWTFSETRNCTQDVKMTWDKGSNDEMYSIAISKTAGADPGPNSDTTTQSFTFRDVKPGTWYVNIKAGSNSCNTSKVVYWKVIVPEPTSSFTATIGTNDNDLHVSGKCLKSITSYPSVGKIDQLDSTTRKLVFTKKTTVKLTGNPLNGKAITQELVFDPDRIIPTPTPTPQPTPKPVESCFLWFCWK